MKCTIYCILLTLLFSCQEEEIITASLDVYVNNIGDDALGNALVSISNTGGTKRGNTSEFGKFRFEDIAVGEYQITATQEGYIEQVQNLEVRAGGTNELLFNLIPEDITISVQDSLFVAPIASLYKIEILSNSRWTISDTEDWIRTDVTSGGGNQEVKVDIQPYTGNTLRFGTIIIQEETIVRKIIVIQRPVLKIAGFNLKHSNLIDRKGSAIQLSFNQDIIIDKAVVVSSSTFCQSLEVEKITNNTFDFSSRCYLVFGREYKYAITGKYEGGAVFQDTVAFENFSVKKNIEGTIRQSFADDTSNSFWVSTRYPTVIYQIDQEDLSIVQQIDPQLSGEILDMAVNHHNQQFYVLDNNQKIYVFDLTTGQPLREINIPRSIADCQGNLLGRPQKFLFTANGTGMLLVAKSFDCPNLFLIQENTSEVLAVPTGLPQPNHITDIALNHDRTKVLVLDNSLNKLTVYDEEDGSFRDYEVNINERYNSIIKSNRKNNSFISQVLSSNFVYTNLESQPPYTYLYDNQLWDRRLEFDYTAANGSLYTLEFNNSNDRINYFNADSESITSSYFLSGVTRNILSDLDGDKLTFFADILTNEPLSIIYQVSSEEIEKE